jgi:acyl-CoA-dependent ceramide synthase
MTPRRLASRVTNARQLAKALNYLRFRKACDVTFGVFLVVWFIARHVLYITVCRSIIVDVPKTMPYGCFASTTGQQVSADGGSAVLANVLQPFNDPDGLVCFNPVIRYGFLGLLLALQILTLIWFGMILRVAYSVLSGKAAQDSRSDDEEELEDEDLEADVEEYDEADLPSDSYDQEAKGTWAEPGQDDAASKQARAGTPQSKGRNRRAAGPARTSAISIPGHVDRKELLGRIGCDKPT